VGLNDPAFKIPKLPALREVEAEAGTRTGPPLSPAFFRTFQTAPKSAQKSSSMPAGGVYTLPLSESRTQRLTWPNSGQLTVVGRNARVANDADFSTRDISVI